MKYHEIQIQDSLITMIFGVGAAVAAFPPVMDFCVSKLGRKGAVLFGGLVFCLGAALQAFAPEPKDGWGGYGTRLESCGKKTSL